MMKFIRAMSLNTRVALLSLTALVIFGVVAALMYGSFERLKGQQGWVEHTYNVIDRLENVMLELHKGQSSQRGYIITGKDIYLDPYFDSAPAIFKNLADLGELLGDNPAQVKRLKALYGKIQERLQHAENVVQTYGSGSPEKAVALIKQGVGYREMKEINAMNRHMIEVEKTLLNERRDAVNTATSITLWIGSVGLLACIGVICAAFALMRKEMLRRAAIKSSLEDTLTQMNRISRENELLGQMGGYFQSCKTVDEVYKIIAKNLETLFPKTYGFVSIFNNSRNLVETVLFWNRPCCNKSREFAPDECWGLRRGQTHHATSYGVEPICHHITQAPPGGSICIPMHAHGDTIGMVCIAADNESELNDHVKMVFHNVSEQISLAIANLKLQEKLHQQTIRDPMTHMYNRRYMEEALDRETSLASRNQAPLSVLMLDIDHFKRFNDTFGHDAGDTLIIEFAKLIQQKARPGDIPCRFGGEEFLVVMPSTPLEEAKAWAEELGEAVRRLHVQLNGKALNTVTVSVGIAACSATAMTPHALIHEADTALYSAKQNGRDRVVIAGPHATTH